MRDKIKQYGLKTFFKRALLSILRSAGIRYEKWLICSQEIELSSLPEIFIDKSFETKKFSYDDFLNSRKFSQRKLRTFYKRFGKSSYHAYGIICGSELVYYSWVSLENIEFSKENPQLILTEKQGMLFDAFCFPENRGNNLHNYMNVYRLRQLSQFGKSTAVVVILKDNIPARKSQKKAGFSCNNQLTTINMWGYRINRTTNRDIAL